jgi:hypothetical protein
MDPNFPQVFHASVESLSATQLKVKTTNYLVQPIIIVIFIG